MIDTHTHLYDNAFNPDGCAAAVDRAVEAGVEMMIMPNVDLASIEPLKALYAARPENTRIAMGIHPTELAPDWQALVASVARELESGIYCAVGEIGIDLYWDKTNLEQQQQAFDAQLGLASKHGLPVIIHCREALDPTLEVIQAYPGLDAVFHSFGGTPADVERILALGDYYFGINGIVTFKNSGLKNTIPAIPLQRLLTETDAPYLAPVPHRGKRNETALMPLVVAELARILGQDFEFIDSLTTTNAKRFFRLTN